jgi:photosystem II stability/assembly factor-like uncharacterized protein
MKRLLLCVAVVAASFPFPGQGAELHDPEGRRSNGARALAAAADPRAPLQIGEEWSALGPFGGDMADVAVSPADANVVLAGLAPASGAGGTLYRATDGGATWAEVATLAGTSVYDIEFAPGGTAVAGTDDGVWRSTDAGATWTSLNLGIGVNDTVYEVFIDPNDSSHLWAGVADHLGNQPVNVLRSTDGGTSWADTTPPVAAPIGCHGIVLDPADSSKVFACFAGAFGGGEVWHSSDGGSTWVDRSAGVPANPLNDLVHDGSRVLLGGGQLFGSQYVGLYTSDDDGATWVPLHDGSWPLRVVHDIELDPADAGTILLASPGAGVYRSTDSGASWDFGVGGSGSLSLNSVRFAPGSSTEIFLGASSIGVVRSIDGGATFVPSSVGIGQLDVWSVGANPHDNSELAVAFQGLNDGGVYSSTDGGQTWSLESCPGTRYSVARFAPDGTLYAVSDGPSSVAPEALYRREANGTWTSLGPDQGTFFESELQALRFSVNDPDLILMGGNDFGVAGFEATVWRSTDAGVSWVKQYESAEENEKVTDIEIVEDGTDTTMVASFLDSAGTGNSGALRSTDSGSTWVKSSTGLPGDSWPRALAGDPQLAETFFLAAGGSYGLYRTDDAGQTWTNTGYTGADVRDVVCDPLVPGVVYIAHWGVPAVARSASAGATFTPFDSGMVGNGSPHALWYASGADPQLLYATSTGSYGRGLDVPVFVDGFESGDTARWSLSVP